MRSSLVLVCVLGLLAATQQAAADPASHTELARRVLLEKMGEGRFDKLDEIYGPGFVAHGPKRSYTLEQDNESGRALRAAFPDLKVSVERTVAADNLVAVHWRATGNNTVASAGLPGKGAKVDVQGMTFFRFDKGRIVEEWSLIDTASLISQVGQ